MNPFIKTALLSLAVSTAGAQSVTQYVDPYIGSGGHGHEFVGASVPFGAVQVGPTNIFKGWDWDSGYNYGDSILIGFSQGADVLPFTVNRLPPAAKAKVRATALIGLGEKASFEFHVTNWLGPSGDKPIAPEASRLSAHDTLCMQGDKEPNSLCPKLPTTAVTTVLLPGNHHFNGAYALLAQTISRFADKAGPSVSPSATAASAAR